MSAAAADPKIVTSAAAGDVGANPEDNDVNSQDTRNDDGVSGGTSGGATSVLSPAQLVNKLGFSQLLSMDTSTSLLTINEGTSRELGYFDNVMTAHGEHFLAKAELKEIEHNTTWTIIYSNKAMYKFDVGAQLTNYRSRKPFLDFHSVEADLSDPRMFRTRIYKDSITSSIRQSVFKFIGGVGNKVEIDSLVQHRHYICQSPLQRDQLVWVLNRAIRDEWQAFLEDQIIPEPDYYQLHAFVMKIKGKARQERLIVVSNTTMYNVDISHNPTKISAVKWGIPLTCLTTISMEPESQANLYFDIDLIKRYNKTAGAGAKIVAKESDNYLFQFLDDNARLRFIEAVRIIHHRATRGQELSVISNLSQTSSVVALAPLPIAFTYVPEDPEGISEDLTPERRVALCRYAGTLIDESGDAPSLSSAASTVAAPISLVDDIDAQAIVAATGVDLQQLPQFLASLTGDTSRPIITGEFEKLTNEGTSSHMKTFALFANGTIKWGDSVTKFKYTSQVLGTTAASGIAEMIPPEKRFKFFALRTPKKPLYLIAPNLETRRTWLSLIDAILSPTKLAAAITAVTNAQAARTQAAAAATAGPAPILVAPPIAADLALSAPKVKGYLTKYTKGGKSSHTKFFCLYGDLTIKWGDNERSLDHSATVIDVDQDLTSFEGAIEREDAVKFIRIHTSTKGKEALELICSSEEAADNWVQTIERMLGRGDDDYDDE